MQLSSIDNTYKNIRAQANMLIFISLSLLGNKKWGTNWIKAKTSKLIKKKNIQNVTMTYRKIEYSFDIRMKIRMLEVYLNLFFECISKNK